MDCQRKVEKFDLNNLTIGQRVVFKPAVTVLQIGATFYISELIKPILLPVLLLSLAVVLLVVLNNRKRSNEFEIPVREHVSISTQRDKPLRKTSRFYQELNVS